MKALILVLLISITSVAWGECQLTCPKDKSICDEGRYSVMCHCDKDDAVCEEEKPKEEDMEYMELYHTDFSEEYKEMLEESEYLLEITDKGYLKLVEKDKYKLPEKLEVFENTTYQGQSVHYPPDGFKLMDKINELIDYLRSQE